MVGDAVPHLPREVQPGTVTVDFKDLDHPEALQVVPETGARDERFVGSIESLLASVTKR